MNEFVEIISTILGTGWVLLLVFVAWQAVQSLRIVPQRYAVIVERLGKYHATLHSGFHMLIPFLDRVVCTIDLKEETIDVPPQECFTKDEIRVIVDGVIYISAVDPVKAAYGVTNYKWAAMQLAQTTTRSVIGKITLDRTFEEREYISASVVRVLDETSLAWGIRVHRYEIKNIRPPQSVQAAMETQVRAERERKAIIAKAEGDKQARISRSEGLKLELVNNSEGEKQRRINDATAHASEIKALAEATAMSLEMIGGAIQSTGGIKAMELQLAEQFLTQINYLAKKDTNIVLSMDFLSQSPNLMKEKS